MEDLQSSLNQAKNILQNNNAGENVQNIISKLEQIYNEVQFEDEQHRQANKDSNIPALAFWFVADPNFDRIKEAHSKLLNLPRNFNLVVKRINIEWIDNPTTVINDYTVDQSNWINEHLIYKSQKNHLRERLFYLREENSTNKIPAHPLEFNNWQLNKFKGWKCSQGLSNLSIDVYGNVYGAHCQQLKLGSIDDLDNLIFPKTESICIKNKCICVSDVMITKSR
jgi:hypothetical protein